MLRHYRNKHGGDQGHTSTKAKHLRITKHPTQTRQQRRKHHPHRRTRQLVGFGRYPYSKGRLRPEDITHIDQALEFLNLVDLQDRYLDELSGSQRQRAYVAMVLAQDTGYADHICAMNNGQITVFGTPRDVMNDETLSRVFHTPVSVFDHSGRLLASYF